MRICIDLDGTICEVDKSKKYEDLQPLEGAIETIRKLKKEGHYIIIHSARNMVTYNNNLGAIIAKQSPIIIDWLNYYGIPFDELWLGKPLADIYIDDKAVKYDGNWFTISDRLLTQGFYD